MDRKRLYHIIEWVVALTACGWLLWKLATYDDYSSLWACLQGMGWKQWLALGVCVALMPVNMSLEAWRWKTLVPMCWQEAHRQVYYSKLAGLITPWRLGEYPARALLRNEWKNTLSMGAVGSATMTAVIVVAGLAGIAFSPEVLPYLGDSYLYALCAVVIVLAVIILLMPKVLKKWAEVNNELLLRSLGQSFARLVCWCVQLMLVLYALEAISIQPSAISLLFVYYLLVTVTPNVPVVEVGVRGVWAMVVFGTMNATLAGVLLWVINTLLPCLIWPIMGRFKDSKI